jgi:drug/metabolite transporter (DMT)-like permease
VHPIAVALILLSAVTHVYWNYGVKRSPAPVLCSWWIMAMGALLGVPFALWLAWPLRVPAAGWWCVLVTGLLYAAYFFLIAQSYRSDDLSRAYPIARGVAPVATAAWGVLYHDERPSMEGWLGIFGIALGLLVLALPGLLRSGSAVPAAGLLAAVGTGLCISLYSAVDKEGVKHVHPVLYITLTYAVGALAQGGLLLPGRNWRDFAAEGRRLGVELFTLAAASVGGYLLILAILRSENVSYVVPVRSVSVLLGVLAGSRLLQEKGGWTRLLAAVLILLGITLIALRG